MGWTRMLQRRRWWDGCTRFARKWVGGDLARLEGGRGGVDQVLGLLLHPLLVVVLDIVLVLAALTVGLAHRRRVVRQVSVTVITVILWHRGG